MPTFGNAPLTSREKLHPLSQQELSSFASTILPQRTTLLSRP